MLSFCIDQRAVPLWEVASRHAGLTSFALMSRMKRYFRPATSISGSISRTLVRWSHFEKRLTEKIRVYEPTQRFGLCSECCSSCFA